MTTLMRNKYNNLQIFIVQLCFEYENQIYFVNILEILIYISNIKIVL